ncbi:hypothetical protein DO65_5795 [Burkholderia pseudomallei]|nr:hypothetical protein DO65_5795 [Burkholderia pseudomallei]
MPGRRKQKTRLTGRVCCDCFRTRANPPFDEWCE